MLLIQYLLFFSLSFSKKVIICWVSITTVNLLLLIGINNENKVFKNWKNLLFLFQ